MSNFVELLKMVKDHKSDGSAVLDVLQELSHSINEVYSISSKVNSINLKDKKSYELKMCYELILRKDGVDDYFPLLSVNYYIQNDFLLCLQYGIMRHESVWIYNCYSFRKNLELFVSSGECDRCIKNYLESCK